MDWSEALAEWLKWHGRKCNAKEHEVMTGYPWEGYSIEGLWSHRGEIWAKYAKGYPHPHEVGLPLDHWFFHPALVTVSAPRDIRGNVIYEQHFRRGRCIYDSRKHPKPPTYAPIRRV